MALALYALLRDFDKQKGAVTSAVLVHLRWNRPTSTGAGGSDRLAASQQIRLSHPGSVDGGQRRLISLRLQPSAADAYFA